VQKNEDLFKKLMGKNSNGNASRFKCFFYYIYRQLSRCFKLVSSFKFVFVFFFALLTIEMKHWSVIWSMKWSRKFPLNWISGGFSSVIYWDFLIVFFWDFLLNSGWEIDLKFHTKIGFVPNHKNQEERKIPQSISIK
jgi:hypothetical protein